MTPWDTRRREEQLKGEFQGSRNAVNLCSLLVRFRSTNPSFFCRLWEVWAVCHCRRAFLDLKRKETGSLTALPGEAPWHAPVRVVSTTCVHVLEREREREREKTEGGDRQGAEWSVRCSSVGGKGEGSLDLTGAIWLIQNNSCKVGMRGWGGGGEVREVREESGAGGCQFRKVFLGGKGIMEREYEN